MTTVVLPPAPTTPTGGATPYRLIPLAPGDDAFVSLAAELGAAFAPRAAAHDRDNTFVAENYPLLRESGYLRLPVPTELGGLGASMRQVWYAQAELARHCGATALAVNMHLYQVVGNAYRWRRGVAAVEPMLRRIAGEGVVLMTSGGSDGIYPNGVAVRDGDGYRVSARKRFCSGAPAADVLVTMAVHDDPEAGREVLLVGIPTRSPGVRMVETWDALGMRATGSHEMALEDVRVGDGQVVARRPWGRLDPVLRSAGVHFAPTVASVYVGVAVGARDEAVRTVRARRASDGTPLAADPTTQRLVGQMEQKLRVAWWSLIGALTELGDDYVPDDNALEAVMLAKRQAILAAVEVVDLAVEAVGGSAYFKTSPLERAVRDVRAGLFHPLTPERTLLYAARLALGEPADTIW